MSSLMGNVPTGRPRGRPKGSKNRVAKQPKTSTTITRTARPVGRPRKFPKLLEDISTPPVSLPKRGRGRPRKIPVAQAAPAAGTPVTPANPPESTTTTPLDSPSLQFVNSQPAGDANRPTQLQGLAAGASLQSSATFGGSVRPLAPSQDAYANVSHQTTSNVQHPHDLDLGLSNTHVLVTGGAGLIGSYVVSLFLTAGALVSSLDIAYPLETTTTPNFDTEGHERRLQRVHADVSDVAQFRQAWAFATRSFGVVHCCVALASLDLSVLPQTDSLCDMDPATWQRVLNVNVGGTFTTSQLWLRGIREAAASPQQAAALKNTSLIIIGSEAGHFGVRTQAAYAAAKSAVQYGLMQSLMADAPRIWAKARVNSVAPGPVDTPRYREECRVAEAQGMHWVESQATVALRQPVPMEAVAKSVVFLASEAWSGHVHGQILNVDSGKQGKLMWAREECD
ncbi:hypothetical protein LTR66_013104 [Elasticomyces elasticus]|nr:hypothetical protein LTR66_013104 [Elasticomyces elasticus]